MNDEPVKHLIGLQFDNFMGVTLTVVWRKQWYRWHWRHFWTIERMDLN